MLSLSWHAFLLFLIAVAVYRIQEDEMKMVVLGAGEWQTGMAHFGIISQNSGFKWSVEVHILAVVEGLRSCDDGSQLFYLLLCSVLLF